MKGVLVTCGAAVFGGLAFCLSLAPTDVWWLAWFAFVPLLVAVRGKGFLYGFLGGLVALLVCALAVDSGVFCADKDTSGLSSWIVTGCALFGFVVSIAA